jgi:hypothetical protein
VTLLTGKVLFVETRLNKFWKTYGKRKHNESLGQRS